MNGKTNLKTALVMAVILVGLGTASADDFTPPSPDPMEWATPPYATSSSSIAMVATTASDPAGVEYYFQCASGGGHDSGWQNGTLYEDTGLTTSTEYTYRVKARDKSVNQNETGWSMSLPATTFDVIYVDASASPGGNGSSWATAYKYLQDALYKPPTGGDEIWVAEGTYYPDEDEGANVDPNDRTETFQLINGVEIYGGFPSGGGTRDPAAYDTILSGDINTPADNNDNSYHVVMSGGMVDETAVLDGFTITAGNASYTGDEPYPDDGGGGMFNWGSPTVANCIFSGNWALDSGGGMNNGEYASPTVTNCIFIGNSANYYDGGGMTTWNSSAAITNCIFSGNSATWGGGMRNSTYGGGSPTVTNCTFSGNSADYGGGMYNSNSSPTVTNCIFWGNTAANDPQIRNAGTSSPTVTYCDVEGGYPGATNIDIDPNFVEPNGLDGIAGTEDDNLRLLFGSPCIDVGNNSAIPVDTADLDGDGNTAEPIPFDLDGNARILGNVVDMGAYEGENPTLAPPVIISTPVTSVYLGLPYTYDVNATGNPAPTYSLDTFPAGMTINPTTGVIDWTPASADPSVPVVVRASNGVLPDDTQSFSISVVAVPPEIISSPVTNVYLGLPYTYDVNATGNPAPTYSLDTFPAGMTINPTTGVIDWTPASAGDFDVVVRAINGVSPDATQIFTISVVVVTFVDANAAGGGDGTSWATAYKYLQDGLVDANVSGDDIWVAAGTYYPDANSAVPGGSDDRTATFQLIDGVGIYGGLAGNEDPCTFDLADRDLVANVTVLSGSDNSYHVVMSGGMVDEIAVLDGFTITAGYADGESPDNRGGGMYNESGSPTVTNCTFFYNKAFGNGGGMYNESGSPTVTNCTFFYNKAFGNGGGMYNYNSQPMVTNSTFRANTAEGLGGGMHNDESDPTVTNCTFSGNSAWDEGGGMCNYTNSSPTVVNCTFSNNTASWGGGMENYDSDPTLTNCILWGNSASAGEQEIDNGGSSSPIVTYTCVQDEDPEDANIYPGTGNIDDDPNFVDPNGPDGTPGTEDDNLRLSPDSNCIDAGDNTAVPLEVATDLDGHPRIIDGDCNDTDIVDMGAYEFNYAYMGDFDYDCDVDFGDFAILGLAWLTEPPDENWNQFCDIAIPADKKIDWADVEVLSANWLAGL